MTYGRPSLAHVAALVEKAVASAGASRPVVAWQHLDETLPDFDHRVTVLRRRLAESVVLLAVQAGRRGIPPLRQVRHVELPRELFSVFHPSTPSRYRATSGGRGSAKSWTIATCLILHAVSRPVRILCAREIQLSLRQSVHKLLDDTISRLGLNAFFDVGANSITSVAGATILFEGLLMNASKLRSLEGIGLCWIEEAESVSDRSLEILIPTVRQPDSEIWLSFNPDDEAAPAYRRFVTNPPPDCRHVHVTYLQNEWLPDVLRKEAEYLAAVDDDAFRNIWLGHTRKQSKAQVFAGKYISEEFTPGAEWSLMQGCDWGFSTDPSVLIRCYVHERTLYVSHEAYGLGVDIDELPKLFDEIPRAREYTTRADSSRPETVSYLRAHGYPHFESVEKWSGSEQDGIAHMRSYERIVIHPRCTHTLEEFRLFSYKTDRLTGDVLPDLVNRHNHTIDSLRYALAPLIRRRGPESLIEHWKATGLLGQANRVRGPTSPATGVVGAVVRDI